MFSRVWQMLRAGEQFMTFKPAVIFSPWQHFLSLFDSGDKTVKAYIAKEKPTVCLRFGKGLPTMFGTMRWERVNGERLWIFEFDGTQPELNVQFTFQGYFDLKSGHAEVRIHEKVQEEK